MEAPLWENKLVTEQGRDSSHWSCYNSWFVFTGALANSTLLPALILFAKCATKGTGCKNTEMKENLMKVPTLYLCAVLHIGMQRERRVPFFPAIIWTLLEGAVSDMTGKKMQGKQHHSKSYSMTRGSLHSINALNSQQQQNKGAS